MTIHIGGTAFVREAGEDDATLLRISDDLDAIISLIDAAFAAAGTLDKADCDPIQATLSLASQFGTDLQERIEAARAAGAL